MSIPPSAFTERVASFASFLNGEHFRFRRHPDAVVAPDETELTVEWACHLEAPRTSLTTRMLEDFRRFCGECMDTPLEAPAALQGQVVWTLKEPALPEIDFDRRDPEVEAFTIVVEANRIEISARHERGLLHGTHALEWMMADRGGPFLKLGLVARKPAFQPRISNGVFIEGRQTFENPGRFSEEYLSMMSHYGVNGIHLSTRLWDIFRSPSLPELNTPDFEARIEALRVFNRRALRCGIDVYLQISAPPLDESHPVFQVHPEVKGARVEVFIDEISGRPWHNLCSGSPTARRACAEAVAAIFSSAPELAGCLLIVGGEGFYHCFTRPEGVANGETNCPQCRGLSPSAEVALLANTMADAIKKTGSHKALWAWPYSAWIWSSQDPSELDWLSRLTPDVSVLSNFDGYDEDHASGAGVRFFDYNIKCIGPSTTFRRQAAACREGGRSIFAKVETNTTPDAFFLPYLPLHFRWLARLEALKTADVAGFVGQWRFFGMNGSLPEELQYKATWQDGDQSLLETICRRDFHLENPGEALEGWRLLSEAWDHFPYSAMTSGERSAYMRGPFYLGPAHPLIFNVQDSYDLPPSFRLLRGDLREMANPEELAELERRAKPRYVSDLLVTLPFGVDRYLALLEVCRSHWTAGEKHLQIALRGRGQRAEWELGIVAALGCHLRTLENVVKFYRTRDLLQSTPLDRDEFVLHLETLRGILDDEIANAEHMLPLTEQDPRIGFGYCYGPVYDAEMIRAKIRQCRFVRDVEIPRFSSVIRFHIWLDSP